MILRLFDYSTAILILLCLTLKFKHRWTWALYMYGCFVYTFINFYRDLPGQAIMNLIAGLIALKNIITYKKDINLMKPVLQAIVIATEEMRDDTLSNKKQITIREGHRDYKLGKVLLAWPGEPLSWSCMREIVSVRHTTMGEITEQEMKDDGFNNYDELETCLKQWYPQINNLSKATVTRWK